MELSPDVRQLFELLVHAFGRRCGDCAHEIGSGDWTGGWATADWDNLDWCSMLRLFVWRGFKQNVDVLIWTRDGGTTRLAAGEILGAADPVAFLRAKASG